MNKTSLSAFSAALVLCSVPPAASAEVTLGVLTCQSVAGSRINLVIRSTADVTCQFKDSAGNIERYKGETVIALGLDLSFKSEENFAFTVISASEKSAGSHALAGKYAGGKATASAGVGLGAAALLGGSGDSFGLNPLAVSAERGIGASAGIGFFYLEADR